MPRMFAPALVLHALCTAPDAIAQNYPVRPIRLIVPISAGGQADAVARLVAPQLSEAKGRLRPLLADAYAVQRVNLPQRIEAPQLTTAKSARGNHLKTLDGLPQGVKRPFTGCPARRVE